jgi:hypothetical protein
MIATECRASSPDIFGGADVRLHQRNRLADGGAIHNQSQSLSLRRSLRGFDTLTRYGGDEFVVILPETTPEGGEFMARRLLDQVRQIRVELTCPDSSKAL